MKKKTLKELRMEHHLRFGLRDRPRRDPTGGSVAVKPCLLREILH